MASPYKSAYNAAKHGLAGLTKTVALENAQTGVTCNAICPGYMCAFLLPPATHASRVTTVYGIKPGRNHIQCTDTYPSSSVHRCLFVCVCPQPLLSCAVKRQLRVQNVVC